MNQSIYKHDPDNYENEKVSQSPQTAVAVRNQNYKLVKNEVNEEVPPLLDRDGSELPIGNLSREQQSNFDKLNEQMEDVLGSAPPCPGDGNGDGVVDDKDISDYFEVRANWFKSSHYDFNLDGLTNSRDLRIIYQNFGKCPKPQH